MTFVSLARTAVVTTLAFQNNHHNRQEHSPFTPTTLIDIQHDLPSTLKPILRTSDKTLYMPQEVLPPKRNWEANSTHRLSRIELQKAINDIKRFVEGRLESDLNLFKVRQSL